MEHPEPHKIPLRVFEINLLRDKITKVEDELAEIEESVIQKRTKLEDLHQQWRDAGLLGR